MSDPMEVDNLNHNESAMLNGKATTVKDTFTSAQPVDEMIDLCKEIVKSTTLVDQRYIYKALKKLPVLRTKLTKENLTVFVDLLYPASSAFKSSLMKVLGNTQKSHVEDEETIRNGYPIEFYELTAEENVEVTAELVTFTHLLVHLYLFKTNELQKSSKFAISETIPKVLNTFNSRILDLINAKLWFYVARCNELLPISEKQESIRFEMIKFLKVTALKHDVETQAMLICCILREFIQAGEISSASDFISKVDFPSNEGISSSLEARYFYYLSKINSIQLDYSTANEYIIAAIRKAPNSSSSLGFLQSAFKLRCCIELLMGDIPELSFFKQDKMEKSLYPYYLLSKAVKTGDLNKFQETIHKYKQPLVKDDLYQLCLRLRSNVIKTGIRIVSLTYKRIALKDICLKLRLDSEQSAEYIVSKAIRDGVIEAKINYEKGQVETSELLNIYDTEEPQSIFNERIKFVTELHDECVKAMRFPEKRKSNKDTGKDDGSKEVSVEVLEQLLSDLSDFEDDEDDFDF